LYPVVCGHIVDIADDLPKCRSRVRAVLGASKRVEGRECGSRIKEYVKAKVRAEV
jgi:hypothetical protein